MRKFTIPAVLATAFAATLAAVPAAAQDAPATNPVFTGPRIAVLGGYDALRAGSDDRSGIRGDDQTVDGFLYGAEIGYDVAFRGALIGVEGEISDSTGKVNNSTTDPNYFGFGRVAADRDLYVGLRAGVLATPSTLIYAKGGYTNAKLDTVAANGSVSDDYSYKLDGYRLGAGVEQAFGNSFLANGFVKLEYRYSNYSDADFRYPNGATTGNFDIDTDRHQVVAGVGIRF